MSRSENYLLIKKMLELEIQELSVDGRTICRSKNNLQIAELSCAGQWTVFLHIKEIFGLQIEELFRD